MEVRIGDEVIVLDAGSGVRGLGERLAAERVEKATLLFSHVHWDHILGFPYFRPAADSRNELVLFGERKAGIGIDEILELQGAQSHAPVVKPGQGARLVFEELKPGNTMKVGTVTVSAGRMNHPDGCLAFRLENEGRAVVYATDTEHLAGEMDGELLRLSRGADALIYDSMYTRPEYLGEIGGSKKGWGHSTWEDGVRLAREAGVDRFVLFHHDPSHDDRFLARLEKEAQADFPNAVVAREGMVLDLSSDKVHARRRPASRVKRATRARR